jgi:D-serine deaminase-like pyridoxal phosphate-dependent protein
MTWMIDPGSPVSTTVPDTPCVVIDLDIAERNLERAQAHFDALGISMRPHIKTHKLPRFAKQQIGLGAGGITCQKLGEAEVMADAGLDDIFLPYNIVGPSKLARLRALARRVRLCVCADSAAVVAGYAGAFAGMAEALPVLVECDTGAGRCGVQMPEDALALARLIAGSDGLTFAGLMTYPAPGKWQEAERWLGAAKGMLSASGLPPKVISSGGTPDMWQAHDAALITEYRPGTYIYMDRYQVEAGAATLADCALSVAATIVSRPTSSRAVLDAGSKALSSDTLGLSGFGLIREYPEAQIRALSEEHAVVDLPGGSARPAVGEVVRIVPNHACVVSNLYDEVLLVRGEAMERVGVAARGRMS